MSLAAGSTFFDISCILMKKRGICMALNKDEELALLHTTVELMEKEARLREELIVTLKEKNDLLETRIAELTSLLNEIFGIEKDG